MKKLFIIKLFFLQLSSRTLNFHVRQFHKIINSSMYDFNNFYICRNLMMRFTILIAFVLFACTAKKSTTEQDTSSDQAKAFDSTVYIGPIAYFEETREMYTPLYYAEKIKVEEAYDSLSKAVDSLLYKENGVSRKRLPYATARRFFKMEGMDTVSIFNGEHIRVGEAKLVRVELFSDPMANQFIAVYKPLAPSAFTTEAVYCASAFETDLKTIEVKYEQVRNERLAKMIFDKFGVNNGGNVKHAKLHIYNSVYSTLDLDSACLLLEIRNDQVEIVYESKEDYCIARLLPTHFEINGRPVLITSMGIRESGVLWTSLAVFSGRQYEFAERCRVKIRE